MTVPYIILGIIIGVPVYILVNIILAWIGRFFVGLSRFLLSGSLKDAKEEFISEIRAERGSMSYVLADPRWVTNIFGWFLFLGFAGIFAAGLIYRLFWLIWVILVEIFKLIYGLLKLWLRIIKSCWNLGGSKRNKEPDKPDNDKKEV